ncbi:MAG TPA: response regulator [Candidatus Acidoferrales bacterium]|nr:response regulator [Candidatus Acidoferrales bacterium]
MPKILIADDNSNVQKTVALVFQERGVQVVSVGNGEAAVRRIPDLDPDLVLADIFMPVRNGYEVCEFVKKDQRFSHIPVILLVGAFDPLDEKEARRAGADGILKKPFVPPDALIAMVMSALERSPRAAAELAKAKEAKGTPEPHPMPQLEVPARKESKPLPNFPEPAPEEAPLAYGFGGSRSSSDEKKQARSEPTALTAEPAAGDAEFDDAADWRRGARDFEIPPEAANLPAFSPDGDWEPAPSSSEPGAAPDAIAPRETDLPATVPFAARALSELETSADDFFEPEQPTAAPAPPQDNAEPSLGQSLAAAKLGESSVSESHAEHTPAQEPHWMDAVAASGAQHPQNNWMTALGEQQAEGILPDVAGQPTTSEANSASIDAPVESAGRPHSAGEETFFADEPEAGETAKNFFVPESSTPEVSKEFDARPFETAGFPAMQFFPSEIDRENTSPIFFKDPALVEPPPVHVTPEPLLVDDEPRQAPEYGSHTEELPPAHSFLVPEGDQAIAEESAAHGAEPHSVGAPSLSAAADVNERIPTSHPPNREALADIPFLVPPPGFRPDAPPESALASDTVDAVVQKVLEKLEPQLHELLSRGVLKPLVESLLQGELAKKER